MQTGLSRRRTTGDRSSGVIRTGRDVCHQACFPSVMSVSLNESFSLVEKENDIVFHRWLFDPYFWLNPVVISMSPNRGEIVHIFVKHCHNERRVRVEGLLKLEILSAAFAAGAGRGAGRSAAQRFGPPLGKFAHPCLLTSGAGL